MKAIRVDAAGGPEAMRLADVPDPQPREGEALVRIEAAGVNFIDVYHRSGAYPVPFPLVPGQEGAGMVVAVGGGVSEVAVGDRVAFASGPGTYAELVSIPAARLVPVPQGVSTKQAAAAMFQGMTAHYLATSTYALKPGDTCLVHAAAGGVGLLLSQIAKLGGARARLDRCGEVESARFPRVPARRGGRGAPTPGIAPDDREAAADPLTTVRSGTPIPSSASSRRPSN